MYIFTDGACINNGKCNSKASFSVYVENNIIIGLVKEFEYEYNILTNELNCNEKLIRPSNNRAELLAIIYGLIYIIHKKNENIELYSDSLISIKTINEWYENRKKKNTLHEFKNLDLISIIMKIIEIIKINNIIQCKHIRSHSKFNPYLSEKELISWKGNYIADIYAQKLLSNNVINNEEYVYIQSEKIEFKINLIL